MEFELMNLQTGAVFHRTIHPVAKALRFLHKTQYSRKLLVLSYRYATPCEGGEAV